LVTPIDDTGGGRGSTAWARGRKNVRTALTKIVEGKKKGPQGGHKVR